MDGLFIDGLIIDGLCTAAAIRKMLRLLMLKVSEGDISLQRQQFFFQFVKFIVSIEIEGKAAKGGVGIGDDQ